MVYKVFIFSYAYNKKHTQHTQNAKNGLPMRFLRCMSSALPHTLTYTDIRQSKGKSPSTELLPVGFV